MRRKMLPKKDAPNGLYLYCSKHRRWYKNDNVVKCKCDLKYKAKVHVPGTKRNNRIRTFKAENFETALEIFTEFKKELKRKDFQLAEVESKTVRPIYFVDCVSEFIDFINDVGVDYQEQKNLSKSNIRYAERSLEYFSFALIENGIKPEMLKFTDINAKIVGFVTEYLKETRKFKKKIYNNFLQNINRFMKYISEIYYPSYENPFKKASKKKVVSKPKSIKIGDFNNKIILANQENRNDFDYKGEKNYECKYQLNLYLFILLSGEKRFIQNLN